VRNGTLPTAWIPLAPLQDLRELIHTRLALVTQRLYRFAGYVHLDRAAVEICDSYGCRPYYEGIGNVATWDAHSGRRIEVLKRRNGPKICIL
jgi:hypothetical protein